MDVDIEKLLSENETKTDVEETADVAVSESSTEEKEEVKVIPDEIEKIKKENERLRKANKTLNDEKKRKETVQEEKEVDPSDPLGTREGWMQHIDKTAEAKAKQMFAPIYEANFRKAKDQFLKSHPEYAGASEENKAKFRGVLELAKASGKVEEGDLIDEMGRAWAAQNWRELETTSQKLGESRRRAQGAAINAASVSSHSSPQEDDFSEEERDEAARYGKSPEAYRKAKKLLEQSSVQY